MSAEKNTDSKRAYKVNPCGSWCEFADNNWQIREGWSLRSVARLLRSSLSTEMVQSIIHISKQVPGIVRQRPFVVTSPSHSRTTQRAHVLSFLFRSKGGKASERGGEKSHRNFKDIIHPWCNWVQCNAQLQQLGLQKQVFQQHKILLKRAATNCWLSLSPTDPPDIQN